MFMGREMVSTVHRCPVSMELEDADSINNDQRFNVPTFDCPGHLFHKQQVSSLARFFLIVALLSPVIAHLSMKGTYTQMLGAY
jgi:hypothetical protein